ncbi:MULTISPECIES: LysE family translocator [Aeromonas]|uniref:LysE family translocator n=1 Tax=Aeromonas TaxID=642 RepID=UPI00259F9C97|nr:LysE family translocator [Aeromonas rivipollensis]MDM5087266.1 LysE family translocator [Aeromonas rivipollensis]MDM5099663.1 LysE family translocator [Aeromonas rivipollensis]MDM5108180.1 LysE family translocator [Aeromonas rivipollensis]
MLGIHDLALFVVSGLLLNMMPGPDSLLIMLRSGSQGWRAGSVAALGIGAGTMVHVLAAALGLSALLSTSAELFTVIKLMGALYLVYLGISLLRQGATTTATTEPPVMLPALSYGRIFRQGLLTNVLNPKVALFFLAFVPQFIDPVAPQKALAFIVLGCIFNLNGMIWCHLLAFSTAYASHRVRLPARLGRWLNRLMGGLFVGLGLKLATE